MQIQTPQTQRGVSIMYQAAGSLAFHRISVIASGPTRPS